MMMDSTRPPSLARHNMHARLHVHRLRMAVHLCMLRCGSSSDAGVLH